ncbi:MAG: hypothetical protein JW725_02050 [Candidatus Babeliaceae bacterium]|nr:hypothetical protein [Candidatus Babeliaceae bacterium]
MISLQRIFGIVVFLCSLLTAEFNGKYVVLHEILSETGDFSGYHLQTPYGELFFDEPVLCALIRSHSFERLKYVRQYGPYHFCVKPSEYTRYDHSLGAFALVRLHGGDLKKQIAALKHDISHTVFSHAGGYFFFSDSKKAEYAQDAMDAEYLSESGVAQLLLEFGFSPENVSHEGVGFGQVKKPAPDLCADNIEYILQGALHDGCCGLEEVHDIVSHLHFNGTDWYFDDITSALSVARFCLRMMIDNWSTPYNLMVCRILGQALCRAVDLGIISQKDIVFGTDDLVWQRLQQCNDAQINKFLFTVRHGLDLFVIHKYDEPNVTGVFVRQGKFRGVDPLVLEFDGKLERLTKLNLEFEKEFESVKTMFEKGWIVEVNS